MWTQLVVWLVTTLIQYVLAPRPPQPPPPEPGQPEVPTAEEGRPIPVVFGTVLLKSPNVVWYGDLRTTPIKKSGGKK